MENQKRNSVPTKIRKNLAILTMSLFIQKTNHRNQRFFWQQLRPQLTDSKKLLGMLVLTLNRKMRLKFLAERFALWRFVTKMQNERLKKVKDKLDRLGQIYNMQSAAFNAKRLREAYAIWKLLLKDDHLRKKFFSVLLKTTFGKLSKCYYKWQNLPDLKASQRKRTGLIMVRTL